MCTSIVILSSILNCFLVPDVSCVLGRKVTILDRNLERGFVNHLNTDWLGRRQGLYKQIPFTLVATTAAHICCLMMPDRAAEVALPKLNIYMEYVLNKVTLF